MQADRRPTSTFGLVCGQALRLVYLLIFLVTSTQMQFTELSVKFHLMLSFSLLCSCHVFLLTFLLCCSCVDRGCSAVCPYFMFAYCLLICLSFARDSLSYVLLAFFHVSLNVTRKASCFFLVPKPSQVPGKGLRGCGSTVQLHEGEVICVDSSC